MTEFEDGEEICSDCEGEDTLVRRCLSFNVLIRADIKTLEQYQIGY
jgi:hypothetical protein